MVNPCAVCAEPLPVTVVRLTSSACYLRFRTPICSFENISRDLVVQFWGNPTKSLLLELNHICLPDVWIVLVNVFMNLVYHNGLSLVRLTERQREILAQKKMKRRTETGVHLSWFCQYSAQCTVFCSR